MKQRARRGTHLIAIAVVAMAITGCENKQQTCDELYKSLSHEELEGVKVASRGDDQKWSALWVSLAKDAPAARDACTAAKDERKVLYLESLAKEADSEVTEFKLKPTAEAWRNTYCSKDERNVFGEAVASCCKGAAVDWRDAKCSDLSQELEKNMAAGKALCEQLGGGSCERNYRGGKGDVVLHASDSWEVAYSPTGVGREYCQRVINRALVEELSPAMLEALAAHEPDATRRADELATQWWSRTNDHWCVVALSKSTKVSDDQVAAVNKLVPDAR